MKFSEEQAKNTYSVWNMYFSKLKSQIDEMDVPEFMIVTAWVLAKENNVFI